MHGNPVLVPPCYNLDTQISNKQINSLHYLILYKAKYSLEQYIKAKIVTCSSYFITSLRAEESALSSNFKWRDWSCIVDFWVANSISSCSLVAVRSWSGNWSMKPNSKNTINMYVCQVRQWKTRKPCKLDLHTIHRNNTEQAEKIGNTRFRRTLASLKWHKKEDGAGEIGLNTFRWSSTHQIIATLVKETIYSMQQETASPCCGLIIIWVCIWRAPFKSMRKILTIYHLYDFSTFSTLRSSLLVSAIH